MAEQDGVTMSVRERIAALKLQEVGRVPDAAPPPSYNQATTTTNARPRPPPPPRPTVPPRPAGNGRTQSVSLPPITDHVSTHNSSIGNMPEQEPPFGNANGMDGISRPALPPRTSTQSSLAPSLPPRKPSEPSPALPPRRPSETPSQPDYSLARRGSNESVSSMATTRSSVSAMSNTTSYTSQSDRYSVRAPSYDPSTLPALPPKRSKEERDAAYYDVGKSAARRPLKSTTSSPRIAVKQNGTTPPPSRRPSAQITQPPMPERPQGALQTLPPPPARPSLAELPKLRRSALEMGMNGSSNNAQRSVPVSQLDGTPPPIPKGSRPDLSALQASKPKLNNGTPTQTASTAQQYCLHCRDFSAPDAHAARFPRQTVPNQDVGWLAEQLTAPFPSLTDKARAIFTWLHHNVMYDTQAFFSGNLQPSTPQSTLASGWAVCEGYAGLFAALAVKGGLEAYVIGGSGKGYGYTQLQPGEPLPSFNANHAWNAVRIESPTGGGLQWKLIDACWGAGHICGSNNLYKQSFSPDRFTQSNEDFGLDHFPENAAQQYRNDGRTVTWEQYITANKDACGAQFFGGYVVEEGLAKTTFTPAEGKIVLANQHGPTVRFSFQKICPHWDPVRDGKGPYYLYLLKADGLEGTPRNKTPFETNGTVWWCDLPVADLGRPGMKVDILALTSFDGRDARGLAVHEYNARKGRVGMSWSGVAKWEVA